MSSPILANKLDRSLPTFVSLDEAAQRYGVSKTVLRQQVEAGTLEAVRLTTGELLVAAEHRQEQRSTEYQSKEEILQQKYGHLLGHKLTLTQAAEKYDVPRGTIRDWYYNGYVSRVDENDYPMSVNEAEVAYCADIYHKRKETKIGFFGAPLLDEDGLPYELRFPSFAKYHKKGKSDSDG